MLRSSGRRCALNTRRRWKRSLLCELLHVRLQHCGRRAGVGNWSLRSFFLAMFVAHRAIDKCPIGNLKFKTDAETISALQAGATRQETLNGRIESGRADSRERECQKVKVLVVN